MQPYFYPYLLYFKMIKAVDVFVFLTDVQYLRRGWMNRNRIRTPHGWKYLTIPLEKSPVDTPIFKMKTVENWSEEHFETLFGVYGNKISDHWLIQKFKEMSHERNLCIFLCETLKHTASKLGIKTQFLDSRDFPSDLRREYRIIDICKQVGCTNYVNLPGGTSLYESEFFENYGIKLEFMPPLDHPNSLSIIDLCLGDGLETI